MAVQISFVIPALNEELNIGNTIASIHAATASANLAYEIILVDHGSRDQTRGIAERNGAQVILHHGGTIGELRNIGATAASGRTLIFIDADVTLSTAWAQNIGRVLEELETNPLLTGSHCAPPADSNNVFLKYWFRSFALDPRNTHLGTGHMIILKKNFQILGGFDPKLRTGEDFEFCERAVRYGLKIENRTNLQVIHHDFPTSVAAFVRREAWHGRGDVATIRAMFRSKVVLASIAFLAIQGMLIFSVIRLSKFGGLLATALLIGLLLLSSAVKNRHSSARTIFINAAIFYLYYLGRSVALIKRLLQFGSQKNSSATSVN